MKKGTLSVVAFIFLGLILFCFPATYSYHNPRLTILAKNDLTNVGRTEFCQIWAIPLTLESDWKFTGPSWSMVILYMVLAGAGGLFMWPWKVNPKSKEQPHQDLNITPDMSTPEVRQAVRDSFKA